MSILNRSSAMHSEHSLLPVAEVFLAAMIWSSSFVAVKVVLAYTGPFTTGGLRYFIAFLMSIPLLVMKRRPKGQETLPRLTKAEWIQLSVMGISQYTIGNAALFFALQTMSATSGSLALSLVPIPVLLFSAIFLHERPRGLQLIGVLIAVVGSLLFFSPGIKTQQPIGLVALSITIVSFSIFPILGRRFARERSLDNITLTSIPLGIGGGALLVLALFVEGLPRMPLQAWGLIIGLASVNTLLAYLLYNHSLQHLTAVQVNVMLNLSPIGTALIAWGALGEHISPFQMAAMFMIIAGASLAQRRIPNRGIEIPE
ncbi:MAG TPA: hypothetical protein ENL23_02840 [Candidatus Acetothermia bacterium]|nr:hypothetical protein [Candidatus Acetothermia bacterium]